MRKQFRRYAAAVVLAASPILSIAFPALSSAATVTWTGGGTDGNWSTAANWSGNTAPVSGDSVVINNAATFTNGSKDDINGLSLAGITFTNNASSGVVVVSLLQNLTLTGDIAQASSVTTTSNSVYGVTASRTITLGGDINVIATSGISLGSTSPVDNFALAGHTVTFTDRGGQTGNITAIYSTFTGTGNVVFNGASTNYQVRGTSTYSGTTHVIASSLPVDLANTSSLGTSAITVEPGGSITVNSNTSATFSNNVTVTGTTSGSPVTSLNFGTGSAGVTLTVPNIVLNGSTRFANNSTKANNLQINIAGITTNGNCIEYLGYGGDGINGAASGFQNGPTGCVVKAAVGTTATPAAPGTPNTGFKSATLNPLATLVASSLAAALIAGVAFKLRSARR